MALMLSALDMANLLLPMAAYSLIEKLKNA
jgi:pyruvate carboxylase